MIEAIQKAYYLRAMNPSNPKTLGDLAEELGLDRSGFMRDLRSTQLEQEFQDNLLLRRQLGVRSFPSLVLTGDFGHAAISHDYNSFHASLVEILGFVKS